MEPIHYRVRQIQKNDFLAVCDIAVKVGSGFTSLPNDEGVIENKIKRSLESFDLKNPPEARFFFFVLEDLRAQTVVGTAAIEACLGYQKPYYCFEVNTFIQQCDALNLQKEHRLLTLVNPYQKASVFETLYVDPRCRAQGQGRFLSRTRALFVSVFPQLFSDNVIAAMRGYFDEKGDSPFWQALGQHFFDMEFKAAHHLVATRGSQLITDLAPTHPIYLSLLPKPAQEAVGQTHKQTLPAQRVLEKEGFVFRGKVDVLDAGPILEVDKQDLKTVKENRIVEVAGIKNTQRSDAFYLMSNIDLDFRATLGSLDFKNAQEVYIAQETATCLAVDQGDKICFCPFR